jgi:hypothetical protein
MVALRGKEFSYIRSPRTTTPLLFSQCSNKKNSKVNLPLMQIKNDLVHTCFFLCEASGHTNETNDLSGTNQSNFEVKQEYGAMRTSQTGIWGNAYSSWASGLTSSFQGI